MTKELESKYAMKALRASYEQNEEELIRGFLRYEALRKLNARQYAELCARNLKGEAFDDMVDELVVKDVTQ